MNYLKSAVKRILRGLMGEVHWLEFQIYRGNIRKCDYNDILTYFIFDRCLQPDSVCIDIGCNKGDILKEMIKRSPEGSFYCFEPIPNMFENLKKNFTDPNVHIYELALSDAAGDSTFNFVVSNPAYSGIKKRPYEREEVIEEIIVNKARLDDIIPEKLHGNISLIKIDVEGGEYPVLVGAQDCLKKSKPKIIFEHSPRTSAFYGVKSEQIFELLDGFDLKISTLSGWLHKKRNLTFKEFKEQCQKGVYYFIASP